GLFFVGVIVAVDGGGAAVDGDGGAVDVGEVGAAREEGEGVDVFGTGRTAERLAAAALPVSGVKLGGGQGLVERRGGDGVAVAVVERNRRGIDAELRGSRAVVEGDEGEGEIAFEVGAEFLRQLGVVGNLGERDAPATGGFAFAQPAGVIVKRLVADL